MKLLVALAVTLTIVFAADPNCGVNEELKHCGSACEPKCSEPEPMVCTMQCLINVCQCKLGYKRGPNGCVLEKDCPKKCDDPNAVMKENGADPNCQMNCEDIKAGRTLKPCNMMLYWNKCYCKDGFVPLTTGGRCIAKAECPK